MRLKPRTYAPLFGVGAPAGTGLPGQLYTNTATNQIYQANAAGVWQALTSASASGTVNAGVAPGVAYYAANGTAVSDGGNVLVKAGSIELTQNLPPTNGIFLSAANTVSIITNSVNKWGCSPGGSFLTQVSASGCQLQSGAATATSPTFNPNRSATTTGIGAQASGNMSGITSATEIWRTTSTGQSMIAGGFTPVSTNGIIGTTTNDNANAGSVGEYVESVVTLGSPTTGFASGTPKNITSISLTAGDWDVCGNILSLPAAATTTSSAYGGLNTVTDTLPNSELQYIGDTLSASANLSITMPLPRRRFSLNATTTVYLVARIFFAVSTMSMFGFINARRVR